MIGWRSLIVATLRTRPILFRQIQTPMRIQKHASSHFDGPPQPFDNLPFSIPNRYVATLFFAVFFGVGFWAPFVILWYMMAKKTM